MKKTKFIISICFILLLLNACSELAKGIGASKKDGRDEFLIEKKNALVIPPSFGELPVPKNNKNDIALTKGNSSNLKSIITENSLKDLNITVDDNETNKAIEEIIFKKNKK